MDMKVIALLFMLLIPILSMADHEGLFRDLKELYFLNHTYYEREVPKGSDGKEGPRERAETLRAQVRPAVKAAFRDIGSGTLTPSAREILQRWTAIDYGAGIIADILNTLSPEEQRAACKALFAEASPTVGMLLLMECYFQENIPFSIYEESCVQRCLTTLILDGFPAGRFYFLLTDENAKCVADTARSDMANFSRDRYSRKSANYNALVSAAFLARQGDRQALKMLRTILEHRSMEDIYEILPVFPCIALTENKALIDELLTIIRTDKRRLWIGRDSIPQEISFLHTASAACSLVIKGFPAIRDGWFFKDEQKQAVEEWVRTNPEWTLKKPDYRRMFFFGTRLGKTVPAQWRALYRRALNEFREELTTDVPETSIPLGDGSYLYRYE